MKLYPASRMAVEYALMKFHYAKTIVNPMVAFTVMTDDDQFCGVICYGVGGAPHLGDEFGLYPGRWIELQRVALNGLHGSTSQAIGISLKLLHKARPCIKLVVSYADKTQILPVSSLINNTLVSLHLICITYNQFNTWNWKYLGVQAKGVKKYFDPVKGVFVHQRGIKKGKLYDISKTLGKHKYVYSFDKKLDEMLKLKSQPYPNA